jgi:hypothetical protein
MTTPQSGRSGTDSPVPGDASPLVPTRTELTEITPDDFRESFGEDLQRALDVNTWTPGDLNQVSDRIAREVREAVQMEDEFQRRIRAEIFPLIRAREKAPAGAGVYGPANEEELSDTLRRIHDGLLFNGGVEACDGTHLAHDTLPLTIHQIGVSLVSYRGNQGTWCQRLFRRDLRVRGGDPVDELAGQDGGGLAQALVV